MKITLYLQFSHWVIFDAFENETIILIIFILKDGHCNVNTFSAAILIW